MTINLQKNHCHCGHSEKETSNHEEEYKKVEELLKYLFSSGVLESKDGNGPEPMGSGKHNTNEAIDEAFEKFKKQKHLNNIALSMKPSINKSIVYNNIINELIYNLYRK